MRAKEFIIEIKRANRRKKKKKKASKKKATLNRYYYPGFGYYGFSGGTSGDSSGGSGDGGGGGGESINESAVTDLAKRLPRLSKHNYGTIDKLMRKIAKTHKISAKKLHDLWVKKYRKTPDAWIKKKLNEGLDINFQKDEVAKFVKLAANALKINQIPKIILSLDHAEAQEHHHTGKMIPGDGSIWVYAKNRNLVDILRTVCHELVHIKQHELGLIEPNSSYPGSPIEKQADELAGKYIKMYGKKNKQIFQ